MVPIRSTSSRSCRSPPTSWPVAGGCSTSGAVTGRSLGWPPGSTAWTSPSASTPRGTRSASSRYVLRRPASSSCRCRPPAVRRRLVRRGPGVPRVPAHRRRRRGDRRDRPRGRAGWTVPPSSSNHPLFQTPGSGWIDDQVRPARAVLAHRAVPPRGGDRRGGRARRAHPVRAPSAVPVRERVGGPNGLLVTRMVEPAPPPGFLALAPEYADAATVPRLLYLRVERVSSVT